MPISDQPSLAVVAHDAKKDEIVEFAKTHCEKLARCRLFTTGTTGSRIAEACPSLDIERVKSGPLGGDQQIGALIAEEKLAGVIFLIDPLSPMPHDVDVKALLRLGVLYDIPMALNVRTAELLLRDPMIFTQDGLRKPKP